MNDHDFRNLMLAVGAGALLWWLHRRKLAATSTVAEAPSEPIVASDPINDVFQANPGAYTPQNLGTINVNIANQGFGMLANQYFPLFGFVGMAQGAQFA
jgi:hypothetical protein